MCEFFICLGLACWIPALSGPCSVHKQSSDTRATYTKKAQNRRVHAMSPKQKKSTAKRAQAQNKFTHKGQNINNLHKQGPDPTESLKSPWGTTFRRYQKTQGCEIPVAQGSVTQGSRGHKIVWQILVLLVFVGSFGLFLFLLVLPRFCAPGTPG